MTTAWRPLTESFAGVRKLFRTLADGSHEVAMQQDVGAALDRNRAMSNHNDGYTPTREMRRVASIPMILIAKWRTEEGWDAFDPACADKLAQKLNDPDYAYLRTAPGTVAMDNGLFR